MLYYTVCMGMNAIKLQTKLIFKLINQILRKFSAKDRLFALLEEKHEL